jgi:uncharacterized protein (DUF983 family)
MTRPRYFPALLRGLRQRCPRCGVGRLFERWQTLRENCPECGLSFEPGQGDTWAFMYLSTAFLTGLILIGMLLVVPTRQWVGRFIVGAAAILAILGTLPRRKGLSVAVDYLFACRSGRRSDDSKPRADAGPQR